MRRIYLQMFVYNFLWLCAPQMSVSFHSIEHVPLVDATQCDAFKTFQENPKKKPKKMPRSVIIRYNCKKCSYSTIRLDNFRRHNKKHEKKTLCECGKILAFTSIAYHRKTSCTFRNTKNVAKKAANGKKRVEKKGKKMNENAMHENQMDENGINDHQTNENKTIENQANEIETNADGSMDVSIQTKITFKTQPDGTLSIGLNPIEIGSMNFYLIPVDLFENLKDKLTV